MNDSLQQLREALAGRYDVMSELGAGGMAAVYLARDLKHGRDVAVKVMLPDVARSLGAARFLLEIRLAARLSHPHVLPLFERRGSRSQGRLRRARGVDQPGRARAVLAGVRRGRVGFERRG